MAMTAHKLTWWQRQRLQKQLHQTQDVRLYRRTLALLEYDRGEPISRIAEHLGVCRRSVHYWIATFAQASAPKALGNASRPGRPARWNAQTTRWLQELLASPPGQWGYLAVDWTMPLLGKALARGTGQSYSRSTIWRELRRLNYVWKRPRYVLRPAPEREKKTSDSSEIGASSAS
jgi:transposase